MGGLYIPDDQEQQRPQQQSRPSEQRIIHLMARPCFTGFWFAFGVLLCFSVWWIGQTIFLFIIAGIAKTLAR